MGFSKSNFFPLFGTEILLGFLQWWFYVCLKLIPFPFFFLLSPPSLLLSLKGELTRKETKPSIFRSTVYDQTGDGLSLWVYMKTRAIHNRRVSEGAECFRRALYWTSGAKGSSPAQTVREWLSAGQLASWPHFPYLQKGRLRPADLWSLFCSHVLPLCVAWSLSHWCTEDFSTFFFFF